MLIFIKKSGNFTKCILKVCISDSYKYRNKGIWKERGLVLKTKLKVRQEGTVYKLLRNIHLILAFKIVRWINSRLCLTILVILIKSIGIHDSFPNFSPKVHNDYFIGKDILWIDLATHLAFLNQCFRTM